MAPGDKSPRIEQVLAELRDIAEKQEDPAILVISLYAGNKLRARRRVSDFIQKGFKIDDHGDDGRYNLKDERTDGGLY